MKSAKVIFCLVLVLTVFFSLSGSTFAKQSAASDSAKVVDPGALEVGDSLISPSSPLYFFKSWREKLELYLAPNDVTRAQRELEFSVRRLREVKTLLDENRQDLVPATLKMYIKDLEMVKTYSANSQDTKLELGLSIARHMYILQSLYYRMSMDEAKFTDRDAIRYILKYNQDLLSSGSSQEERELFRDKLKLREIAACQFLRTEARASDMSPDEKKLISEVLEACRSDVQ